MASPGIVPFELTHLGWATLDETGWSVQSDTISFRDAAVTITRDDGANLPVVVTELLPHAELVGHQHGPIRMGGAGGADLRRSHRGRGGVIDTPSSSWTATR